MSDKNVEIHHYTSLIGKICTLILFPIYGLVYGFFNRGIYEDYRAILFQRKCGSFVGDNINLEKHPEVATLLGINKEVRSEK